MVARGKGRGTELGLNGETHSGKVCVVILPLCQDAPPTHSVFTMSGNPNPILTLAPFWAGPRALPSGPKIAPGSPFSP